MPIRKLTPDLLDLVNEEIRLYLAAETELITLTKYTDPWFKVLQRKHGHHKIIMSTTGLTMARVDDLIYNKVNTATYWLPSGAIRPKGQAN